MKFILSFLIAFFISASISNVNAANDKESKTKHSSTKSEITKLFNKNVLKPLQQGSVIALIKIDENGYGKVLESNASTPELEQYVKNQVEGQQFRNLKSDTIKLKVQFKN